MQLQTVDEQRFLELVRDAQLQTPVAGPKLVAADAHVLVGIGRVAHARRLPVAHLTRAEEVGDELEPLAVPCEQERTGRRFAIELLDYEGRWGGRGRWAGAAGAADGVVSD